MGADPKCSALNSRKAVVQDIVEADSKGDLANVFVRVQGNFPPTAIPAKPVAIDQSGCIYNPRVVGMQLGQTLDLRNNDALAHNVHSVSKVGNNFDLTLPAQGQSFFFKPSAEEVMLRVGCDVHKWMTAYVGIVNNPYFAVSNVDGTFEIPNVPAGTYAVQAWHEKYGETTKNIKVQRGQVAIADFTYPSAETQNSQ